MHVFFDHVDDSEDCIMITISKQFLTEVMDHQKQTLYIGIDIFIVIKSKSEETHKTVFCVQSPHRTARIESILLMTAIF